MYLQKPRRDKPNCCQLGFSAAKAPEDEERENKHFSFVAP